MNLEIDYKEIGYLMLDEVIPAKQECRQVCPPGCPPSICAFGTGEKITVTTQIWEGNKKERDLWRVVVLVEDEDADVDIGVEGGGSQVKGSHGHVVHLVVAAGFVSNCARKN